jgi:hypothetical protein
VHVYQDPPLLGSFPVTLEGSQNIFIATVATHREPDPTINNFGISRGGIILAKHHNGTQCRDSIGVEVEQLAVQIAHNGYQELAGRKSQSSNQMRLEANYGGALKMGTSTSGTEEIMLPVSQPRSW